jgi:Domain of unknown function (DUF1918)/Rv2632c-like
MHAQVGDRLVIEANRVGVEPRGGVIVEVLGAKGRQHYRVRWDDGRENTFYPGSDSHIEHRSTEMVSPPPTEMTTAVELRIEEDADHTDVWATLRTQAGAFTGWGRARRNPVDSNVPLVGEELATARALMELADVLRAEAGQTLESGMRPAEHLVG